MSKPRRACGYIRESTGRQVLGLGVQKQAIERYVKAQGWEFVRHYVDAGQSGASFDRPAFSEMIADLRTGLSDVVVVARLDRVGRNLRGLLAFIEDDLKRLGVELVSVAESLRTDDPVMGKALIQILGALAELERDLIVERTKPAVAQAMEKRKREAGPAMRVFGTLPLGYKRANGKVEVHKKEARIVRTIFKLYANQKRSMRAVAAELAKGGVLTRSGAAVSPTSIRRILSNSFYTGTYTWNRAHGPRQRHPNPEREWVVVPNHHPALVDAKTFGAAQRRLAATSRGVKYRRDTARRVHLLSGLAFCARCGSKLWTRGPRNRPPGYRCASRTRAGTCDAPGSRTERIEAEVVERVSRVVQDGDFLRGVRATIEAQVCRSRPDLSGQRKALEKQGREIDRRLKRLEDVAAEGVIDGSEADRKRAELAGQRERITRELLEIEEHEAEAGGGVPWTVLEPIARDWDRVWSAMSREEQRAFLQLVLERVEVDDGAVVAVHFREPFASARSED